MKNIEIINLKKAGVSSITAHTLSASHAYKVYKFKRAIDNAFKKIQEAEMALMSEVDIESIDEFNKELAESEVGSEKKAALQEKAAKFNMMQGILYGEDTPLEGVLSIPYDEWHKLQNENAETEIFPGQKVDVLSGDVEFILEGILWELPE